MKEIWKDIPGYEGFYQASNLGRIKSMPRKGTHVQKEYILKQRVREKGYCELALMKNCKRKNFAVHRLIAMTFIPNPLNLPQVDHIDDNKQNNCVDNLQWITNVDNMAKAWRTGARSIEKTYKRGKDNVCSKAINQYDLYGNFIKTWYSITEAEKYLGLEKSNIGACCKHKRHKAYGYKWEYANKE